eukprot:6949280-Prymnesium_polylepis.2
MGGRRRGRARSNGSLPYLSECRVCRRTRLAATDTGRNCTRGCARGPGGHAVGGSSGWVGVTEFAWVAACEVGCWCCSFGWMWIISGAARGLL